MKINPMPSPTYRRAGALLSAALVSFVAPGCLLTIPAENEEQSFRPPVPDLSDDNNDDNNDTEDMDTPDMTTPDPDMGTDMGDMNAPPTCTKECTADQNCEDVDGTAMCVCDSVTSTPDGDGGCTCRAGYSRRLTAGGGLGECAVALTCADVPQLVIGENGNPPMADGLYPLAYSRESPTTQWLAWCADLSTSEPKTYLPLKNTGLDVNTFEFLGDLDYNAVNEAWDLIRTSYYMIRIDPTNNFRVDIQDRRFARTTVRIGDEQRIEKEPTNLKHALDTGGVNFGTISTCTQSSPALAKIDLSGTGFKLAQRFERYGNCHSSTTTASADHSVVSLDIRAQSPIEQPDDTKVSMSGGIPRPSCTSYGPSGMLAAYGIQGPISGGGGMCSESNVASTSPPQGDGSLEDGYILRLAPDIENAPITGSPTAFFNGFLPQSCMEAYAAGRGRMNPPMGDSEQTLYINREQNMNWRATCVSNGDNQYPVDYLMLDPNNQGLGTNANVFVKDLGTSSPATFYNGVRIDPYTQTVDINDRGKIDALQSDSIEHVPYATAERSGNYEPTEETNGQVDLSKTSFDITDDMDGAWEPFGTCGPSIPAPVTGEGGAKYNVKITDAESPVENSTIGLAPLREALRTPLACDAHDNSFDRDAIEHIDPDNEGASYTLQLKWVKKTSAPE